MTNPTFDETDPDRPAGGPRCGACGSRLGLAPASVVFRGWHARCLERAMSRARATEREETEPD